MTYKIETEEQARIALSELWDWEQSEGLGRISGVPSTGGSHDAIIKKINGTLYRWEKYAGDNEISENEAVRLIFSEEVDVNY